MNEWTTEERDRIVAVFEWLLKEDRKQNPENYQKKQGIVSSDKRCTI